MAHNKSFHLWFNGSRKNNSCNLLASDYKLQYVSASGILLKRANIDTDVLPRNFWLSSAASRLRSQRSRDQSIDVWVDQQMIAAATVVNNVVFDSWGLPWLSTEPGLRIWLESSVISRYWKAIISQERDVNIDSNKFLAEMNKKDNFTREYFLSKYGFDLFQDHKVFDYILDITNFISAPTHEASRLSISKAQKLINSIGDRVFIPTFGLFRRIAILNIEDDFAKYKCNLILVGEKMAMHAAAIVYCLKNNISLLADGTSGYQENMPEQMPEAVNKFYEFNREYGISYVTPIRSFLTDDDVKYTLMEIGISTKSLEGISVFAESFSKPPTDILKAYIEEKLPLCRQFIDLMQGNIKGINVEPQ